MIIQKFEIMKVCSVLRDSIRMNDLFYSTEMLRFDKEMDYRSVTGGILSLGIIAAVLVGFASMIIDTLSLNTINSIELITKDSTPSTSNLTLGTDSNFMIAVEMWGVNASAPVRYFDVLMIQLSTANGQREYNYTLIPLEACTREHWAAFPNIAADYDRLAMNNWLCPPINTTLQLSGDYTSNIYKYVNISVNPCMEYMHPDLPCASASEVTRKFRSLQDAIHFKIYYTNPLINSGQKIYKTYYLESSSYISFGATIGGEAYLYTSDYSITTDNSIWPYPNLDEDDGLIIQDKFEFHPYTTFYGTYAAYYLVKSPTNYIYQREVQKISTVFSFIGGLVSAISAALFIFKAYNTFAFELTVAISIFKPPDDAQAEVSKLSMNFITFFQYYFYQFCRKVGRPRQWPTLAFLTECREEIVKQLDVKALVKRLIFLQYCMTNLFEDYQLEGLQIQKPKVPSDIARIREKCQSLDTYEDHLFFGENSKHSEKQEQESQSSSSFSSNKDSLNAKIDALSFKLQAKPTLEIQNISDFIQSNSNYANRNSPAPLVNDSMFRILTKNRVHPIDPINEEIQVDSQQIDKPKKQARISKQMRASKAEKRRSINLSFLKKNAEQGNALSKKIWEQLEYFNCPSSKPKLGSFIGLNS